jgi:predicted AAA+ superfamily ATPase
VINRPEYIQKLLKFKDKHLIKVITGLRRSGKSTLLEMYRQYLIEKKVKPDQIISLNFEEPEFEELRNHKKGR